MAVSTKIAASKLLGYRIALSSLNSRAASLTLCEPR